MIQFNENERSFEMSFKIEKIRGLKVVALKGSNPFFRDKRFKSVCNCKNREVPKEVSIRYCLS